MRGCLSFDPTVLDPDMWWVDHVLQKIGCTFFFCIVEAVNVLVRMYQSHDVDWVLLNSSPGSSPVRL